MVIVATAIVMMDIWGRIFFVGNNNITKKTINRITVDGSMATTTVVAVADAAVVRLPQFFHCHRHRHFHRR